VYLQLRCCKENLEIERFESIIMLRRIEELEKVNLDIRKKGKYGKPTHH